VMTCEKAIQTIAVHACIIELGKKILSHQTAWTARTHMMFWPVMTREKARPMPPPVLVSISTPCVMSEVKSSTTTAKNSQESIYKQESTCSCKLAGHHKS
jgi:hypothetical protein